MAKFTHSLSVADDIEPEEKPLCHPQDAGHHGTGVGPGQQAAPDGESWMVTWNLPTAAWTFAHQESRALSLCHSSPILFASAIFTVTPDNNSKYQSSFSLSDSLHPAAGGTFQNPKVQSNPCSFHLGET